MASGKLTARKVETAKPGRHGDGAGLWLIVSQSGARRWALRFNWRGKPTETGLGSFPVISLADARDRARETRKLVRSGVNPIVVRQQRQEVVTLRRVVNEFYDEHSPSWRSEDYRRGWKSPLNIHSSSILDMPVNQINAEDIRNVLEPIWLAKPQTARLLRAKLESVFDYAIAKKYREDQNPALKKGGGIAYLLPKQPRRETRNHPAMQFNDVIDFVRKLRRMRTPWAGPLLLQIFCATRPSEALGARWEEIDLNARIWRLPGERTKNGKTHEIPLSTSAVALLERLREGSLSGGESGLIFPGRARGKPLSQGAERAFMRRIAAGSSPHGFRSSMRDFLGDATDTAREIAEMCLAHSVGSSTERAYRRGTALERRRIALQIWAEFLECGQSGNVLPFQKSGGAGAA